MNDLNDRELVDQQNGVLTAEEEAWKDLENRQVGKFTENLSKGAQAKRLEEKALMAIAKTCHEANRAYCQALGDDSQPEWESAPAWQKESAIKGVAFHIVNPTAGPEASHNSWMKEKIKDGWVCGDVKCPINKTHPCMVPFEELPKEQQAKDYIFRAIVHALR